MSEENKFYDLIEGIGFLKRSVVPVFRFDDVSGNSNEKNHFAIAEYLRKRFPDCKIVWGISTLTHKNCGERVYPKIFNAYSNYRKFYAVEQVSVIEFNNDLGIIFASHGLIHVDHRLLALEAQEMSILVSCSLTKSKIFIPPFNKWNHFTDQICRNNNIELVKFEDGWRCLEYEQYDPVHKLWYLHAREWTLEKIKKWFGE